MDRNNLSPMFLVSVEIYKMGLQKEKVTISELRKRLPNIDIKKSINKCLDLGSIQIEWVSKNGGFYAHFYISSEMEILIQRICIDFGEVEIKVK